MEMENFSIKQEEIDIKPDVIIMKEKIIDKPQTSKKPYFTIIRKEVNISDIMKTDIVPECLQLIVKQKQQAFEQELNERVTDDIKKNNEGNKKFEENREDKLFKCLKCNLLFKTRNSANETTKKPGQYRILYYKCKGCRRKIIKDKLFHRKQYLECEICHYVVEATHYSIHQKTHLSGEEFIEEAVLPNILETYKAPLPIELVKEEIIFEEVPGQTEEITEGLFEEVSEGLLEEKQLPEVVKQKYRYRKHIEK